MKNKKTNSPFILLFFIGIIALIFLLVFLIQNREEKIISPVVPIRDNPIENFSDYFPGCNLINDSCLSTNCDKYFLCNDKKYVTCEIYDCKKEFGIVTVDESGKIKTSRKIKDDRERITEIKSRCDGKLEILKNECIEEKLEMQVKVETVGDCVIGDFMVIYKPSDNTSERRVASAEFSGLGDRLYLVKTNNCEEISELVAVGDSGVSIR
ncbi:MAG: hypothetical protein U9P70_03250 [Patescibacteria group bacterium]|nr:hypothetical protein [Patescibacteria group bacterium]